MSDTIVLTRAEYEALLERIEDAEDALSLLQARARRDAMGADKDIADCLPLALARRIWAGEHPLRVWRDHRAMTGQALAEASGVPRSYISEIETGRKPGSLDATLKLAKALGVTAEDLVPISE